jgi:hypothetical protein
MKQVYQTQQVFLINGQKKGSNQKLSKSKEKEKEKHSLVVLNPSLVK